jgi:hypothetical protein
MNRRRLDAVERQLSDRADRGCTCVLTYQFDEPPPPLTGACPSCGRPRMGGNILIELVVVTSRKEADAFDVAEGDSGNRPT